MEAQEREEEYLELFKEMALEPEEKSAGFASEEDYLELFMAHSQQAPGSFAEVMSTAPAESGLDFKFSRFISGYPKLDPNSGIGLIRLSSAVVPPSDQRSIGRRRPPLLLAFGRGRDRRERQGHTLPQI